MMIKFSLYSSPTPLVLRDNFRPEILDSSEQSTKNGGLGKTRYGIF